MTMVSVSELKARLSEYLRLVRRGGEVEILDRGRPVARLVGVTTRHEDDDADARHRDQLVRAGIVRSGDGGAAGVLDRTPIRIQGGLSEALAADRVDRV